ncbi:hypothetical protein ABTL04_20010, partial [Acinetobacter baumannii]
PMMAAYLLKPATRPHTEPFWMPAYMKAARWAFTHKGKTLAITAAFSVAACTPLFMGKVPGAFLPPDDLSQSQINLELPPGSTYEETRA